MMLGMHQCKLLWFDHVERQKKGSILRLSPGFPTFALKIQQLSVR